MTQKLLLTSNGITNDAIRAALVNLLGKPIEQATALYVPTAIYAYPKGGLAAWMGAKQAGDLGWKEFGLLELTALPSVPRDVWLEHLTSVDVLMVGGGNKFYLSYWMERTGLFDLLPQWLEQAKVYVGLSAGSMMMTPALNFDADELRRTGVYHDDEYDERMSKDTGSARTLGLVDFVVRPHYRADYFPQTTPENVAQWAAKTGRPLYALDDQSALKLVDGQVEVVSQGEWKFFDAT